MHPTLARRGPVLLVLLWACAAVLVVGYAAARPGHDAMLGALSTLAGLGLAACAWRGATEGAAALPLAALVALPLLDAAWWQSPWPALLALPPLLWLAAAPEARTRALPRSRGHAVLVLLLAYLAVAPALDALVAGPPAPPVLQVRGMVLDAAGVERLPSGGLVREQRLPPAQPFRATLLAFTMDAHGDLPRAVQERYAKSTFGAGFTLLALLALVLATDEAHLESHVVDQGWLRVDVVREETTAFLFLPFLGSHTTERQVFLLRPVTTRASPTLLPPFAAGWTTWAGVRLEEPGNVTALLARLDGNLTADGVPLDPPLAVVGDDEPGARMNSTPMLGDALVLAAVVLAARVARRKP